MIQVKAFKIDDFEKASKFLRDHGSKLPKDAIKFVGTTDPRIVIMYNEFEIGSDEDAREGWTMELAGAKQQLLQYEQQLAENEAAQATFKTNENGWNQHQETIKATRKMVEIQKSKIATVERLIKTVS